MSMTIKEIMQDSILEFLSGTYDPDNYVGLSVMTDGLKAARDHVIGFCAVDGNQEILFTILVNGGDPAVTEPYHQIPMDKFETDGIEPADAYSRMLDALEGKYIVVHSLKFTQKFLSEFTARNNLPPLDIPMMSTELLQKASVTSGTLLPALQEDGSMAMFTSSLNSHSYPRGSCAALDALYMEQRNDKTDWVNRLPNGVGNAYKVASIYKRQLELPLFGA